MSLNLCSSKQAQVLTPLQCLLENGVPSSSTCLAPHSCRVTRHLGCQLSRHIRSPRACSQCGEGASLPGQYHHLDPPHHESPCPQQPLGASPAELGDRQVGKRGCFCRAQLWTDHGQPGPPQWLRSTRHSRALGSHLLPQQTRPSDARSPGASISRAGCLGWVSCLKVNTQGPDTRG